MERQVRERLALLSHLIPSMSYATVGRCPLWLWRQYRDMADDYVREQKKQG